MHDWPEMTKELSAQLRNLHVMKAFAGLASSATAAKALDAKTKELSALGIAVAVRRLHRVPRQGGDAARRFA